MSVRWIFALLLVLSLWHGTSSWAQNPFMSSSADKVEQQEQVAHAEKEPRTNRFLALLNSVQREFREKMAEYAKEIRNSPSGATTLSFLGLTFAFGVLHALGPGHGKTIVCSYFLSRRGSLKQVLLFGNLITVMHVLSATVIILTLTWVGEKANIFAFQEIEGNFQPFSYLLITLIGTYLLFTVVREILASRKGAVDKRCSSDGRSMTVLSLTAGLIPCPGAALILLFTLSYDILWAGLAAMVVLAAGMGLTNSLVGAITMGSRGAILRIANGSPKAFRVTYSLLALGGALMVVFLGSSLFLSTLGP